MRLFAALALSLCLTGAASADSYSPQPGDLVTASATGLHLRSADGAVARDLPFGTGFQETLRILNAVHPSRLDLYVLEECGAGPVISVYVPDLVGLLFQEDRFVGWSLNAGAALRTQTGVGVASPRAALAAEGAVAVFDSTLGLEFEVAGLFGVLSADGNSVDAIWAGVSCVFR